MPLTEEQIARVRDEVGPTPSDDELDEIYDRPDVEDEYGVISVVLRRRMADFTARPASLNIPGEVATNHGDNMKILADQMKRLGIGSTTGGQEPGRSLKAYLPQDDRPIR